MRKGIKTRIDRNITNESSIDNDGKLLQELSCTFEYKLDEFKYIKTKLESKYGIKLMDYFKRAHTLEQWDKIKGTLVVIKQPLSKKLVKPKVIKEDEWNKTSVSDLSPIEALQRFRRLKAKEKKQQLLEEVKNIGLLLG